MVSKLVCMMLWVVFLLGGWCWCPGDACWDEEKAALLQLKPFFDSYIDGVNNWGQKGSDCCEWEYVECDSSTRRVIRLFLNLTATVKTATGYSLDYWIDQREEWYLNVSLFHPFEELQTLHLSRNSLAGFLDHRGFEKVSWKLEKLEILDLTENHFDDSVFATLSELSSLKYLNLGSNRINGSNPNDGDELRLKKLEVLDLSWNRFDNTIFSSLTSLPNLKYLDISFNRLEGPIHIKGDELRLKKLEVLDLSHNRFNNTIFSSLTSLPNLKYLDISFNRLEGPIHIKDINALSSLEVLYMWYNRANDFLPSQDNERLMNLKSLHLRGNYFNDSILPFIGNLSNLKCEPQASY